MEKARFDGNTFLKNLFDAFVELCLSLINDFIAWCSYESMPSYLLVRNYRVCFR